MKNLIFLILLALALFLSFYFYRQQGIWQTKAEEATARISELEQHMGRQRAMLDSVNANILDVDTLELVPPGGAAFVEELGSLSNGDIKKLQRKGLRNPEADLQTDLMQKQQKLLPEKGVLGGSMQIRDIRILTGQYALAYFEDGHKGGYMLLHFTVNDGQISWKTLHHYLI